MQLHRLQTGLRDVLSTNAFWRARLTGVRGWDDFDRLPLTTKSELIADQAARPPFGTNLTFPLDRYVRLHQTSGSSGARPLRWLDTAESWDWWLRIWADHLYPAPGVAWHWGLGIGPDHVSPATGVTAADRLFFAFSFGPFVGFWSAFGGAERVGAMVISGAAMTTEQRIRNLRDVGATVLLATPTYALRMAEAARELRLDLTTS